jgi:hypothetical protein
MNVASLVWVACILAIAICGDTQTDQTAEATPVPVNQSPKIQIFFILDILTIVIG